MYPITPRISWNLDNGKMQHERRHNEDGIATARLFCCYPRPSGASIFWVSLFFPETYPRLVGVIMTAHGPFVSDRLPAHLISFVDGWTKDECSTSIIWLTFKAFTNTSWHARRRLYPQIYELDNRRYFLPPEHHLSERPTLFQSIGLRAIWI